MVCVIVMKVECDVGAGSVDVMGIGVMCAYVCVVIEVLPRSWLDW